MSRKCDISVECYVPVGNDYARVGDLTPEQRMRLGDSITQRVGAAIQEFVNLHPEVWPTITRLGVEAE